MLGFYYFGNLFVWYVDSNSGQWVNCSQAGPRGADGPRQRVFSGDDPPTQIDGEPVQEGDLWFNSDQAQLFMNTGQRQFTVGEH